MEDVVTWNVNQYMLIGFTLALFGFVGFRRGANRELISMIGVAIGVMFSNALAVALRPGINRLNVLVRFALAGGISAEDPTTIYQTYKNLPELVKASDQLFLSFIIFAIIIWVFYFYGEKRIAGPHALASRIVGLLAGGINGFLVGFYLFPMLFPKTRAVINLPGNVVNRTLGDSKTWALAVFFFIVVLVIFGLYSSSGPGKRRDAN
jgi:hypothetical protein